MGLSLFVCSRVRNIYSVRDLITKLKECDHSVRQKGCDFLLDGEVGGFDVFYSVLGHFHRDLSSEAKDKAWEIVSRAARDLTERMGKVLEQGSSGLNKDKDSKEGWLTKTKMLLYVFCQMMEMFETQESSSTDVMMAAV